MSDHALPSVVYTPEEHDAWEELNRLAAARLKERCERFKIPPLRYQPADDLMLVFRLKPVEIKVGGLHIPTFGKWKDQETGEVENVATVLNEGVLLKAGCGARDWMRSHGILIGDIIKWGHFAGNEELSHRFQAGGTAEIVDLADWLQVPVRECHGSYDLDDRIASGQMRFVYVVDKQGNGLHVVKPAPIAKEAANAA